MARVMRHGREKEAEGGRSGGLPSYKHTRGLIPVQQKVHKWRVEPSALNHKGEIF
jgi:hypothetical protein